ncbi:hypothetical protein [Oxynema aestuarii]|uniref:Uncharacterized protein n=1 Tax=Oxynema aestuarii AP17 TaxID=2064643 RepID=A0A6H1U5J1_9CYAN|nr:hypothetical protein [Oxynema aestuarii]QIZ73303.1 hypothetical protein HCG48_24110 [Oxynema aestuarii AP17]
MTSIPGASANDRWVKPPPKISLGAIRQALATPLDSRPTDTGKDRQGGDPIAFPGCRPSARKLTSSLHGIVLKNL